MHRRLVLELYALQSGLARAERRLATLAPASAELAARRGRAAAPRDRSRRALARAAGQLGARLRTLYDRGRSPTRSQSSSAPLARRGADATRQPRPARATRTADHLDSHGGARGRPDRPRRALAAAQAALRPLTDEAEAARDALLRAARSAAGLPRRARRPAAAQPVQIGNLAEQAQAARSTSSRAGAVRLGVAARSERRLRPRPAAPPGHGHDDRALHRLRASRDDRDRHPDRLGRRRRRSVASSPSARG